MSPKPSDLPPAGHSLSDSSNRLKANAEPSNPLSVWNGTLTHIFISSGHDYWGRDGEGRFQHGIQSVDEVRCVTGKGLVGDRYFRGRANRKGQVTFFDADVVQQVRDEFRLPKLPASIFRRNLIIRGITLGDFLGREFVFQGIHFEGSQECRPCHWMSRVVADGTEAFLRKDFRGGLRAKIKSDGILRVAKIED